MIRFTIRELLLLTLCVGFAVALYLTRAHYLDSRERLEWKTRVLDAAFVAHGHTVTDDGKFITCVAPNGDKTTVGPTSLEVWEDGRHITLKDMAPPGGKPKAYFFPPPTP